MKKFLLFTLIAFLVNIGTTKANFENGITIAKVETQKDSVRLVELDKYWTELSRTVREGDFEGYKSTYHEDGVVIFAIGENKTSMSISSALGGWKKGFEDTKSGKVNSNVEFRFSQRIGDETTAHETGIFHYTSADSSGKSLANQFVHFEMLMVKINGEWKGVMEYQKSIATQEEWIILK